MNKLIEGTAQVMSIKRLTLSRPEIARAKRGLPHAGERPDGHPFYPELKTIDDAYKAGNEVYSLGYAPPLCMSPFNLGNGSPLRMSPFTPAVQAAASALSGDGISQYAFAAGDASCRRQVAAYWSEEGLRTDSGETINERQVIFFNSVTEAFSILMQVICRPGDVVIFTAPTYGLFAYAPERAAAVMKTIPLREENGWLPDPEELERVIIQTNASLKARFSEYPYTPCVTAFVNLNPCNPTGLVMGPGESRRLRHISDVCLKHSVFVIDDLIYRDLCFDPKEQALPVATFLGAFSNTITLFGTSKCYGLAGARAGGVVADEVIIRGLRNEIFQLMDSTPLQVSFLMAGTFCPSIRSSEAYQSFFCDALHRYRENWAIVENLILGMRQSEQELDEESLGLIREQFGENAETVLAEGIDGLTLAGGIRPESGFFVLVDLSSLRGRIDPETGNYLENEMDVLYYFYRTANIKLLTGSSFAWPIEDQIVARVSFAYSKQELILAFYQIWLAIGRLE